MKRKISERFSICLMGAFLIFVSVAAYAAVPQTINYQGYLTDAGGNPINATVQMTFAIYNVSSGGSALWTETQTAVPVSNGIYNVVLGSVNQVNLSFNEQYYLSIQVGTDLEMSPRQQLTGVPYSMRAKETDNADTVDGQHASAFASLSHSHDADYVNEGQAGSISNSMIADSAVTNAKITGQIDASKIQQGHGSTLNADFLDGKHASDFDNAIAAETAARQAADSSLQTSVNAKQNRVTGACAAGSSITGINEDGTAVCSPLFYTQEQVDALLALYETRIEMLETLFPREWKTAVLIETTSGTADYPQIAMDGSGNAIAVWRLSVGVYYNIRANRYTAGSGWGTAALVETDTGTADSPQIAMDGSGNATAVWRQYDGTYYNIWANRYTAEIGWGTAAPIENNAGHADFPQIAMDGSGNAIAVWRQHDGTYYSIWAKQYGKY